MLNFYANFSAALVALFVLIGVAGGQSVLRFEDTPAGAPTVNYNLHFFSDFHAKILAAILEFVDAAATSATRKIASKAHFCSEARLASGSPS